MVYINEYIDVNTALKNSFISMNCLGKIIDIEGAKIDCLSLFKCPLLAQLKIGFFSSFSDAAVYSTNEANKAGLKQSIIFRCLWIRSICFQEISNAGKPQVISRYILSNL
jgi:hypothetical protein